MIASRPFSLPYAIDSTIGIHPRTQLKIHYPFSVMKRFITLFVIGALALPCFGQRTNASFVASVSGMDRMSMVKSSIDVPSWHEKSFWPLYEKYMNKVEEASSLTYRALDNLAAMDKNASEEEALAYAQSLMSYRTAELAVRQQYYTEISKAFNGVIALQFIQTEALLDMVESARIYDASPWKKYRFHPKTLESTQLRSAKYNTISTAIGLPSEKAVAFYRVYTRYEEESNALLGDDYSLYGLYAGQATDYTPALGKQLGNNLLLVIQRENKLKEKYFKQMNDTVGSLLAARFLAWEDYYSLTSKMYAWADAP
jgi:hypothetical protein